MPKDAERRLRAAWVAAPLALDVGHSRLRGAELLLLGTNHAKLGYVVHPGSTHPLWTTSASPCLTCLEQKSTLLLPAMPKEACVLHPWVAAPLGLDVGHSLLGVLGVELRLLATNHAERLQRGAPWVAAPLVDDLYPSLLGVSGAELRLRAAGEAEARARGAPLVNALPPGTSSTLGACTCGLHKALKVSNSRLWR